MRRNPKTKRTVTWFYLITVAIAAITVALGCADNDDDSINDDVSDDDDVDPCQGNIAPAFTGLTITVNGENADLTFSVKSNDDVALFVDYDDPNCNMGGGSVVLEADADVPEINPYREGLKDELPCNSSIPNIAERTLIGVDDVVFVGTTTFEVWIEDGCGTRSEETFEVTITRTD